MFSSVTFSDFPSFWFSSTGWSIWGLPNSFATAFEFSSISGFSGFSAGPTILSFSFVVFTIPFHRRFSTTLTFPFHSPSSHRTVSSWMFVEDVTVLGLSSFIIVDSLSVCSFGIFYNVSCFLVHDITVYRLRFSLLRIFGTILGLVLVWKLRRVKWRRVYCVWKINYITMRFKYHFPIGRNTINPCFLTFSFLLFDS